MLVGQMNRIKSYRRYVEKKVNKPKKQTITNKKTRKNKIIIKAQPKKQSAKDYLMSFTKRKKKSGMELIYGAIKK